MIKTIIYTILAILFYIALIYIFRYSIIKIPYELQKIAQKIRVKADEESKKEERR